MNGSRTKDRHTTVRNAATFVAAASIMLGLVVSAEGLLASGRPAAAAAGVDTYVLTDFDVAYPYVPGPRDATATGDTEGIGDPTSAGVTFTARWSGSSFPGQSTCHVSVYDPAGLEVGQAEFLASYATPTALPPVVEVEVSGEPSTAAGTCGAGSYPPGDGYVFDNAHVDDGREAGLAEISFDAHWVGQTAPGWRSCSIVVQLSDGERVTFDFGYHAPDGSRFTHVVDAQPSDIVQATVACSELRAA